MSPLAAGPRVKVDHLQQARACLVELRRQQWGHPVRMWPNHLGWVPSYSPLTRGSLALTSRMGWPPSWGEAIVPSTSVFVAK